MRTYARLALLAVLCLCTACGLRSTRQVDSSNTADEAQLLQLEKDMFTAIRTRDRQMLERILDETFELRVPGSPPVERAGFITAILAIPGTILSVESDDLEVRTYGDVGVLIGRQRARVQMEDGATVTDVGAFTDIAIKRGGQWRMVLAHSVTLPQ
ncbi:nuclear transport factor 2 family protein [Archangium gephyra]|uniref:nuclear transport factor 2 family protein n=1 Tax=Archangium gephyra TaxID=48 RepID=UPI0035D4EF13